MVNITVYNVIGEQVLRLPDQQLRGALMEELPFSEPKKAGIVSESEALLLCFMQENT